MNIGKCVVCGLPFVTHVPTCEIEFSLNTAIKTISEWIRSVLDLRSSLATAFWHLFPSPPLCLLYAQN